MDFGLSSLAHSLRLVRWDTFATLTWEGCVPPIKRRFGIALSHLRRVCLLAGVPPYRLLYALRDEDGEIGKRPHFHCLVGGSRCNNARTFAARVAWDWRTHVGHMSAEELSRGEGAIADVRAYDPRLDGVGYIVKDLSWANAYELAKFGKCERVRLSGSVVRLLRSMRSDENSAAVSSPTQNQRVDRVSAPALTECASRVLGT